MKNGMMAGQQLTTVQNHQIYHESDFHGISNFYHVMARLEQLVAFSVSATNPASQIYGSGFLIQLKRAINRL